MAATREEILADFQACTGIEDVGECILHLEETNWNLLDAINRVMPQETQTLPSEQTVKDFVDPGSSGHLDLLSSAFSMGTSSAHENTIQPSTSHNRIRLLNFSVEFKDRMIPISVPDSETVGTIKSSLHSELGVPPCSQDLRGWKAKVTDDVLLSTMNLPTNTILQLFVQDRFGSTDCKRNGEEPGNSERMAQTFKLNITDENNHKQYSVNYLGSKTIREVKQDVFSFTDIHVRHQVWTGWPPSSTDSSTLANCGVDYPCHNLTVKKATANDKNNYKKNIIDIASDSSSEEFEDASESFNLEDDIFIHDVMSQRARPLMPDNVQDETEALIHFTSEFSSRYGECHPMFYQGSLDDALKEACAKPARERRLLALYLHHDSSVLANVFCTQLLCSETVVSYLSNNFITWAWDMTNDINRENLLTMVTRHFGIMAANTIKNFSMEQLPLLLIIMRSRASTEVFTIVHGSVSLDELLTSLIHAVDVFSTQQHNDMREEDEREARELVKREQDLAYEASLKADRIKEETKRLEVQERQRKEKEIAMERQKEELKQQQQAAVKEAIRQSLEGQLPSEPPETYPGFMSQMRFRLPGGVMVSRRFRAEETLQTLLDFLVVEGYHRDDYKVLTSWPRRDLTTLNPRNTLEELKLFPQETIILEERLPKADENMK